MSTHKSHLTDSETPGADPADSTPADSPKFSWGGFIMAIIVTGFLILASGFAAWSDDLIAGILVCFGVFAKTISLVIGAASKDTNLKGIKPEIDERLGYLDALAAIAAFPALFAVGAELLLQTAG